MHLLGDIATHPDRFDAERAEAHYRKAMALAEPRGMRPLVAHCHLGLGRLYRRTGEREQAQEHLDAATRMYREMDMQFWLEQAEAAMREISSGRPRNMDDWQRVDAVYNTEVEARDGIEAPRPGFELLSIVVD